MGLSYFFNTEIKIFRGMKNEPFERVFRRFPHGGMARLYVNYSVLCGQVKLLLR